jgi:hypothetical protein
LPVFKSWSCKRLADLCSNLTTINSTINSIAADAAAHLGTCKLPPALESRFVKAFGNPSSVLHSKLHNCILSQFLLHNLPRSEGLSTVVRLTKHALRMPQNLQVMTFVRGLLARRHQNAAHTKQKLKIEDLSGSDVLQRTSRAIQATEGVAQCRGTQNKVKILINCLTALQNRSSAATHTNTSAIVKSE